MSENTAPYVPFGYLITTLETPAFRLPEGTTKEAARSLLKTLSESMTDIKLPDDSQLKITSILRDADEFRGEFCIATQFQLSPKP